MKRILILLLSILILLSFNFNLVLVSSAQSEGLITLDEFENASVHTSVQKGFLSSPIDYYSYYGVGKKENSRPDAVELSWTSNLKGNFVVEISEFEDLSNAIVYTTTNKNISVYNFKIATKYFWRVSFGVYQSEISSFVTEGYYPRNLNIDKVSNVRDLGGFTTSDGSVLKQGMIYRGGRFNKVNAQEITISEKGAKTLVNTLGIKTEIDLRVDSELGGWSSSILNTFENLDHKVKYYNFPLDPSDKSPYYYLLRENNIESTKKIFEVLSDEDNYPIYFHCSLGTDRAGELADILHYLCSVSCQDVDYDYAFSNLAYIGSIRDYDKPSRTALQQLILNYGDTVNGESTAACLKDKLGLSDETINNIINILKCSSNNDFKSIEYDDNCLSLNSNTTEKASFIFDSFVSEEAKQYSLQMKVKASKDIFVENAIKVGTSRFETLCDDDFSDVVFSTEWNKINIDLSSTNQDLTKYISMNIPKNCIDVEFYFADIVLFNENKRVEKVINTYQHYNINYNFVQGIDYNCDFDGLIKVVNIETDVDKIPNLELTMLNGAEMRVNGSNGLRFVTNVNSAKLEALLSSGYSVEFGTLIAPADYLNDPDDLTLDLPKNKYLLVPYDKELYNNRFKGSIINILENSNYNPISGNLNRDFVGRGYARISKNGFTKVVYADLNDNVRSISKISYLFKEDVFSDYLYLDDETKAYIDKCAGFYNE